MTVSAVPPCVILAAINAYNLWEEHWEHWAHDTPLEERTEYPYQNIRVKNFPFGDGDKVGFLLSSEIWLLLLTDLSLDYLVSFPWFSVDIGYLCRNWFVICDICNGNIIRFDALLWVNECLLTVLQLELERQLPQQGQAHLNYSQHERIQWQPSRISDLDRRIHVYLSKKIPGECSQN